MRQGPWEFSHKDLIMTSYVGLGSERGCRIVNEYKHTPLARGTYTDDRKTGTWEYYGGYPSILERRITYHKDGSFKDENIKERYELNFSSDSLTTYGWLLHYNDTISIICANTVCTLKDQNSNELIKISYADANTLEIEILKLSLGMYNRVIKQNQYAR